MPVNINLYHDDQEKKEQEEKRLRLEEFIFTSIDQTEIHDFMAGDTDTLIENGAEEKLKKSVAQMVKDIRDSEPTLLVTFIDCLGQGLFSVPRPNENAIQTRENEIKEELNNIEIEDDQQKEVISRYIAETEARKSLELSKKMLDIIQDNLNDKERTDGLGEKISRAKENLKNMKQGIPVGVEDETEKLKTVKELAKSWFDRLEGLASGNRSQSFNDMKNAVGKIKDLDENSKTSDIIAAVEGMQQAAQNYSNTHSGIRWTSADRQRRNLSNEILNASQMLAELKGTITSSSLDQEKSLLETTSTAIKTTGNNFIKETFQKEWGNRKTEAEARKAEAERKAEEANLQKKAESKPEKEEMDLSGIEQEVINAKNHIRQVVHDCKENVPDNSNLAGDYATIIASKFYTDKKKERSFVDLDAYKDNFFEYREKLLNDTSFKNVMKEGKPENLWKTALNDSVENFMDAFRLEENRVNREKMREAAKMAEGNKTDAKNFIEEKQKRVKEQVPSKTTEEMKKVNVFLNSKIKDAQEKIKEVVKENNGMIDNNLLTEHYATIISASRERKEMMDSNNLKHNDSDGIIINTFDSGTIINRFKFGCLQVKYTPGFKTVIEKGNEILLRSAALNGDGSSLMSVFQAEEDRIDGKDMNFLDEKISKAQESINSAVNENKGEVPDNKELEKEYATIAAVTQLKSLKSKNPYMYFDESDVQSACSKVRELEDFTQAMKNCPKDILKDAACEEKGGQLFDVIVNKTYAPKNDEINLNNNSKIPVVEHANEKAVEEKAVEEKAFKIK